MKTIVCHKSQVSRGPLILVNRDHPLRDSVPCNLVPLDARYPNILFDRNAARLLEACVQKVGGSRDIVPVSGWRSQEEQQQLWDDTLAKEGERFTLQYVALPGCSEHQTGLAIDLGKAAGTIDFIRPAFPYDGICGAFRRMAARYGFVERYTRGKEHLTGIAHEPWHFRYVGVPHAQLMTEHNLCLEEYSDFLRQAPRSCTLPGGQLARVFYVPCAGDSTEIELPEGCCQVSGDNDAGFIITIWGIRT